MLKWPPSNTLTASTIYDAGTQPSAGKAPWFLKKGCLSEQTERHQTVTGPGDRRKTRNGSVSGLGLRVTAHGAKSFVHSFRFNGKHRRSVIGCPDTMNVTSARFMVLQRNNDIAAGIDPDENMKTDYRKKYGETLGDVIDAYFEQHLPSKAPSHHAEFSRLIAPWTRATPKNRNRGAKRSTRLTLGEMYRDTLVADLTPQHIGPYLQRISADSIANNTLRQLRALFNWVIRMQIVDMRNPCSPFQMRKMIKQRRDYTPEQVKEIARHVFNPPMRQVVSLEGLSGREKQVAALKAGHATQNHDQLVELCNYMGILFLTMARPIEVKTARFEHFDLDRLIWHKHNTKGIKLSRSTYEYAFRSVPIHPKVAELVRHQRARWPESDLLFPNHADQMQPRDNFQRAIKRFKQLDGVPSHFQLYDLKRMAISMMMVGQGVRREDVSHYVDHRGNLDTTLIYDLGFVDPLRPVTQKLGEVLGV
ncbi:Phage integrase family protein [Aliiroseovarius halocynthiae]|nr:Phage integrase family protein [Aliiroseovarius halocynthiae]